MAQGDGTGPAAAVVLAGGTARRFGGGDKTRAAVGGDDVLGLLLGGLPPELPVVLVGPDGPPPGAAGRPGGVTRVREDPPGGGPAAGLAAGLAALPAGTGVVVALAGDQPFAAEAVPRLLRALADAGTASAVAVDPGGHPQPLLAAYRVEPLRRALGDRPAGQGVRRLLAPLSVTPVPVSAREALDVDTPEDLATARRLAAGDDPGTP